MQNVFKPFAAKVTDSLNGPFQRAQIVLTFVYVLILLILLFLSSSVTYSAFSRRLTNRFEHYEIRPPLPVNWPFSSELVNGIVVMPDPTDLRADLIDALLVVNSALLMLAGVLSYWLAGLTLRPVQAAYNRQRQFLSDASHELRTPLAIMQTDLENQLAMPGISLTTKEQLVSHLEEVQRMGHLVKGLLELSRLDEHAAELNDSYPAATVGVKDVVKQAVERLQQRAVQAKVVLKFVENPEAELVMVQVNKELLLQALSNVIVNAILYNKPAGQVTVSLLVERQRVLVEVQDMGLGMSEEDVEHAFERFYRADASRSRKTGGSGLGLAIAQSIARQFGGGISLTSKLNEGTKVTISLPIHRAS